MHDDLFELGGQLEQVHWWFVGRRRILRSLADQLLPRAGAKVVDIGCGTGGNIAGFLPEHECLGLDCSLSAIQIARRHWPGVCFQRYTTLSAWTPLLEQADLCLLTDVLEHVPDDFLLFSHILAGTRPGSHVLVTVPADMSLWGQHDETHGHYRRYDADRLTCLWKDLPVTPLLVSPFNSRLYPLIRWVRANGRRRGRAHGVAGTDLAMPPAWLNALLLRTFATESGRLVKALQHKRSTGFRRGVSLLALLRREPGKIVVRTRPSQVPPDPFVPQPAQSLQRFLTADPLSSPSDGTPAAPHAQIEGSP